MQEINNSKVVAATTSQISPTSSSPEQQQTQLIAGLSAHRGAKDRLGRGCPSHHFRAADARRALASVHWLHTAATVCLPPTAKPGQAAQMLAGLLWWLSHQGRVLRSSTPWDDLLPCGNSSGTLAIFQREHF